jgi:hypothetical protein
MTPPNAAPRLRDVIEEEITQGVFGPATVWTNSRWLDAIEFREPQ